MGCLTTSSLGYIYFLISLFGRHPEKSNSEQPIKPQPIKPPSLITIKRLWVDVTDSYQPEERPDTIEETGRWESTPPAKRPESLEIPAANFARQVARLDAVDSVDSVDSGTEDLWRLLKEPEMDDDTSQWPHSGAGRRRSESSDGEAAKTKESLQRYTTPRDTSQRPQSVAERRRSESSDGEAAKTKESLQRYTTHNDIAQFTRLIDWLDDWKRFSELVPKTSKLLEAKRGTDEALVDLKAEREDFEQAFQILKDTFGIEDGDVERKTIKSTHMSKTAAELTQELETIVKAAEEIYDYEAGLQSTLRIIAKNLWWLTKKTTEKLELLTYRIYESGKRNSSTQLHLPQKIARYILFLFDFDPPAAMIDLDSNKNITKLYETSRGLITKKICASSTSAEDLAVAKFLEENQMNEADVTEAGATFARTLGMDIPPVDTKTNVGLYDTIGISWQELTSLIDPVTMHSRDADTAAKQSISMIHQLLYADYALTTIAKFKLGLTNRGILTGGFDCAGLHFEEIGINHFQKLTELLLAADSARPISEKTVERSSSKSINDETLKKFLKKAAHEPPRSTSSAAGGRKMIAKKNKSKQKRQNRKMESKNKKQAKALKRRRKVVKHLTAKAAKLTTGNAKAKGGKRNAKAKAGKRTANAKAKAGKRTS